MKPLVLIVTVLTILFGTVIYCGEKAMKVRKAILAGQWYSSDKADLENTINDYFSKVPPPPLPSEPCAIIVPHAGYVYSGATAAYGYNTIRDRKINRVIILAPSHRVGFEGISIADADYYETPLGKIKMDRKSCDHLLRNDGFSTVAGVHDKEHSLEIQLPFLQKSLKNYELIPLVVGHILTEKLEYYANIIKQYIDNKTVIIVSSDFTHYGNNFGYTPFEDNIEENIKKLDMRAFEMIKSMNVQSFIDYKNRTGATICGYQPIALLMKILPPQISVKLLHYDTSGNITGDFRNSVSYMSIVFFKEDKKESNKMNSSEETILTTEEQDFLLNLARKTIKEKITTGSVNDSIIDYEKITPALKEFSGLFVTLEKNHQLRGCIGYIEGIKPLYKAVIDNAVSAATRDPRFHPVEKDELKDLHIEISVMTPLKEVESYEDIIVGKHGVVLTKKGRQSVFLPQVAPEQGWDRDEMLTHLAMKAGLPANGWKENCNFKVFEAQIFEEN